MCRPERPQKTLGHCAELRRTVAPSVSHAGRITRKHTRRTDFQLYERNRRNRRRLAPAIVTPQNPRSIRALCCEVDARAIDVGPDSSRHRTRAQSVCVRPPPRKRAIRTKRARREIAPRHIHEVPRRNIGYNAAPPSNKRSIRSNAHSESRKEMPTHRERAEPPAWRARLARSVVAPRDDLSVGAGCAGKTNLAYKA